MTNVFSLDGKVALVTGASRGLGRSMALALAGFGAHVVVNGRNESGIANTCDAIERAGGKTTAMAFDTTDVANADSAVDRIEAELGHLDILVNNAGYGNGKTATEASNVEWNEVIEVDLNSCFRLAKRASVGMIQRCWGRIINISSINAHIAREANASYCSAKAGLEGMTRALAVEWGAKGVTVNAIAPGYIDTDMVRAVPPNVLEKIVARIPVGRLGRADEIARAVLFLVADDAGFITGSTLSVNGGQHMY